MINCTMSNINISGIGIYNTNEHFILRNIVASGCGLGIQFSNVSFGSILNSYAIDNTYFGILLNSSSSNNILENNIESDSDVGFELSSSNNNVLINNTADNNNIIGFGIGSFLNTEYWGIGGSNNTLLQGNTAINNNVFGFSLIDSSNNLIKNNTAIYNVGNDYFDDYTGTTSGNNTLLSNNFIISNNKIASSFSVPLTDSVNIICITILIALYCLIGYEYFSNSQRKKIRDGPKIEKAEQKSFNQRILIMQPILFGLSGSGIIVFCTFSSSFLVINFENPSYSTSYSATITQLSVFSGILVLLGGIAIIVSIIISYTTKSYNRNEIAQKFLRAGLITQIVGIVLVLLTYFDVENKINTLTAHSGALDVIQILSLNGFLVLIGGVLFISGSNVLLKTINDTIKQNKSSKITPIVGIVILIIGLALSLPAFNSLTTEFTNYIPTSLTMPVQFSYIIGPSNGVFLSLFGAI